MAYVSQERKASLLPAIKAVLKKYGVKGTVAVRSYSTLTLTVKSGGIDFIGNCNHVCGSSHYHVSRGFRPITQGYTDVNEYWYHEHFDGVAREFLKEVLEAMNVGNWDHSDIMSDYFNKGWYTRILIGKWDAPYVLNV
jgi:hypothetical protein